MPDLKKQTNGKNATPPAVPSFFVKLKEESGDIVRKPFPSSQETIERMPADQLRDIRKSFFLNWNREIVKKMWDGIQPHFTELHDEDVRAIIGFVVAHGHANVFEFALATNRELVERALDENTAKNKRDRRDRILVEAAGIGSVSAIKFLIDKGANITAMDSHKWTPLISAGFAGRADNIKILLDKAREVYAGNDEGFAAFVNAKNEWGETALGYAVNGHHVEASKLLIETGSEIWDHDKDKLTVQLALGEDVDVNAKDNVGVTLLIDASRSGHLEIVKCLIELGADVNAETDYEKTALRLAEQRGHKEIVNLLRRHGGIG